MPIILLTLFYACGIFLTASFNIYAVLLLAALFWYSWRQYAGHSRYSRPCLVMLFLLLGIWRTSCHQAALADRLAAAQDWSPEPLYLRVVSDIQYKDGTAVFTARAGGYKIMARIRNAPELAYGDELILSGHRLTPLRIRRNFFITGYDDYLYAHGYTLRLSAEAGALAGRTPRRSLFGLAIACKNKFVAVQKRTLPEAQAGIMCTFLFGSASSSIDSETVNEYRRAGVIHLLVVSGMHITLFITLLQSLAAGLRLRPWPAFALITGVNVLFIFAVGAGPSVLRAGLMAEIALLGRTLRRSADTYNTLALSGLGLCLRDPLLLFDAGFQLSFAATFSLLFLAPVLEKRLARVPGFLRGLLAVSTAPLLLTLPLCVYYFHGVSLGALFLNMLVLPWVELLTYLGFITSFLGLFCMPAAFLLNTVSYALFVVLDWLVGIFACTYVDLPQIPLGLMLLGLGWPLLLALYPRWLRRYTLGCGLVLLMVLLYPGPDKLRVIFLDVGQGDCILLTRRRKALVIDCGSENDLAGETLRLTLLKLGIRRPDVLLTHAHLDHYSGLLALPEIGALVLPESINAGLAAQLRAKAAYQTDELPWVTLYRPEYLSRNENNNSVLALLAEGGFRALFTGDAEAAAEGFYLDILPEVDVLKAGHHGSKTSSTAEFLAALRPDNAVISAGAGNRYRHPSPEALDRLSIWSNIWRTDLDGAVMLTVHPEFYRLTTRRSRRTENFGIRVKYF
ncbi:MAG: DNA internalization-related competence protein ComEC/Rec2 [Candidatus Margulisbacteria bacterium]|jgi:competence protein ComEC|nr:DNA internalization-related competence protein ComEC/Rec2 [Candidatus Margulisiibacteriota bacterium]